MTKATNTSAADGEKPAKSSLLVDPLLEFTAGIFLSARENKRNFILSPISIHKALNLVLLGAAAGTQTEREIEAALGYVNSSNEKYHQAHAGMMEVLDNLNKGALEAMQSLDARNAATTSSIEHKKKPTMVTILSELVAKTPFDLNPVYLEQAKNYYGSSVDRVCDKDPASKTRVIDRVNRWAKEAGFASDLLEPTEFDRDFSVNVFCAIRVEAFWFYNFHEMEEENIFYNHGLEDELVKKGTVLIENYIKGAAYVELTSNDRSKYKYLYDRVQKKHGAALDSLLSLNARVVQIPMEDNIKFTLFEPLDCGNGDELAKMLGQLLGTESEGSKQTRLTKVFEIIDDPEMSSEIEHLRLPKFKFESDLDIMTPLKAMGIKRAFDKEESELSNIEPRTLYIDKAKHQAVIEVNRFGLKAAAITQLRFLFACAPPPNPEPIRIKIDKPFLFMVRYHNIPLFVGQLVELQ